MILDTVAETVPAAGWEDLLVTLRQERGTAMFLGATDVGKSTLVRWLVERLRGTGRGAALVDADVGQSTLCLPGTVGMRLFREEGNREDFTCNRFAFLGSPSPARIIFPLVEAAGRFAADAHGETDLVLIDTTGLVSGELGVGLKLAKIRATGADRVIAIQRRDECEPILERLRAISVCRLAPPPLVRTRSQETRTRRRNERLASYFARACAEFIIHAGEAEFSRFGRDVSLRNILLEAGAIVGLNHGRETLALGAVTEADRDAVSFRSPLGFPKGIDRVVLGELRLEASR
jgi:polynucleotide 5'-hydroxyl-kinase GRC3/NOL9